MRGLEHKVIVVAGGGTADSGPGNGAATAIRLADEGASVVVGDLSGDAAKATVAIIEERGGRAVAIDFDIAEDESVRALVACAVDNYGAVNGLHVNAADMSPEVLGVDGESDLLTIPLPVWQRTLDVNLTGFLLAARATIPHLLEAGGGGITNTVSDAIYAGEPVRVGVRDHQERADGGHAPHRQPLGTRRDPLQLDLTGDHRPQRGDRSRHARLAPPRAPIDPGRPSRRHRVDGRVPPLGRRRVGERSGVERERRPLPQLRLGHGYARSANARASSASDPNRKPASTASRVAASNRSR